MTKETALRRLDNRVAQLGRLIVLEAPEIIVTEQRRMVAQAQGWVDNPPADIPD